MCQKSAGLNLSSLSVSRHPGIVHQNWRFWEKFLVLAYEKHQQRSETFSTSLEKNVKKVRTVGCLNFLYM